MPALNSPYVPLALIPTSYGVQRFAPSPVPILGLINRQIEICTIDHGVAGEVEHHEAAAPVEVRLTALLGDADALGMGAQDIKTMLLK